MWGSVREVPRASGVAVVATANVLSVFYRSFVAVARGVFFHESVYVVAQATFPLVSYVVLETQSARPCVCSRCVLLSKSCLNSCSMSVAFSRSGIVLHGVDLFVF